MQSSKIIWSTMKFGCLCFLLAGLVSPAAASDSFETVVVPFVTANCYGCHNEKLTSGGLNLRGYPDAKTFVAGRENWQHVLEKLKAGEMPPKGMPRPAADQVSAVTGWLQTEFDRQDREAPINPGRVTARRLNRYEYNATIRDLLGVDFHPADDFPADDFGYGFDNIGDVLSLSPALMEKYLNAAKKISRAAIDAPEPPKHPTVDRNKNITEIRPYTWSRNFVWDGDYDVRFAVPYEDAPGRHDPGTVFLSIDGEAAKSFPLPTEYINEGRYIDLHLHLKAGVHRLAGWAERDFPGAVEAELKTQDERFARAKKLVAAADAAAAGKQPSAEAKAVGGAPSETAPAPGNPPAKANAGEEEFTPSNPAFLKKMRALLTRGPRTKEQIEQAVAKAPQPFIEFVEVRGPYHASPAPRPISYSRIFVCGHAPGHHTQACVRTDLAALATRAWRRPVTAAETAKLVSFVRMAQAQGNDIDDAMKIGVMAVLVAPDFLFRVETEPGAAQTAAIQHITPFQLATRLSYFIWSSMPDEELFRLARTGELGKPAVLDAQVRRMLKDPKAAALVDNFGSQWLETRNLDNIKPDPDKFPEFNEALKESMKEETRLFLSNVMLSDGNILDLLTAKYSFLNERLAKYYGIAGVTGDEFRKVDLGGTPRVGVLTQASILTVSSYPTRTSPVVRGKWILENILNTPPPPPPANVPSLEASAGRLTGTLRQQLELHRSNAVCAGCHSKMDPLGFGLENFDAIGRWRTMDGNFPIDSKGTLPNGESFTTPEQMVKVLAQNEDAIARCLTEKLLTFALGRGVESYDRPAINDIVRYVNANGDRFSSLVFGIVHSAPFQLRQGNGAMPNSITQTAALKTRAQGASQ